MIVGLTGSIVSRRIAESQAVHDAAQLTDVLAAYEDPTKLIERFTEAARRAIELGAEVLIPGAGPLNLLLADKNVTRIDDVPVLDSLGIGLKFCEMRVDLYRQSGLKPCRRGLYFARPPRELVDHMRGLYFTEPAGAS